MKFTTGSVFGNRYTLGERIAVGGMGEVWEATDQVLGRIVAIKLLSPALADQQGFAERFREEARNTASLQHPNIATVYDYGEDSGANWLVMELVRGEPLSAIIAEHGSLAPERASSILAQAADALQAAHDRGVVHRDVKPANIMVTPAGQVKLTDFGISRATDAAPITRTGEVMGTAQYISPEQATGQPVSPASDVYALGCVAYEMVSGTRPFDEGSPVATAMAHVTTPPAPLPASVPAPLASLILACLAKAPSDRPKSAREVAAALRGAPTSAFAPTVAMGRVNGATERLATPGPRRTTAQPVPPVRSARHEDEPQERKRLNPLAWIIPLVLVLAVLAYLVTSGLGGSGTSPTPNDTPSTTSSTSQSSTTDTGEEKVQVTASDYIGLSYDEAAQRINALGLEASRGRTEENDAPRGQVIGVSPSGEVSPGSTITLTVSAGPAQQTQDPTTPSDTTTSESPSSDSSSSTQKPSETATSPDTPTGGGASSAASGGPAGTGIEIPAPPADTQAPAATTAEASPKE